MPTTPRRVLVVEDDESMREALERLLGVAGFEPVAYASAEALLAAGLAEDAACVVSDLRLPAMSGLELLAALRARGWRAPLDPDHGVRRAGPRRGGDAARRGRATSSSRSTAPRCSRPSGRPSSDSRRRDDRPAAPRHRASSKKGRSTMRHTVDPRRAARVGAALLALGDGAGRRPDEAQHPDHLGRRHRLVQRQRLQPWA